MKCESADWMERLHVMRRLDEEQRIRDGISLAEWLRRVGAEADAAIADVAGHEEPLLARDRPTTRTPRARRRKP